MLSNPALLCVDRSSSPRVAAARHRGRSRCMTWRVRRLIRDSVEMWWTPQRSSCHRMSVERTWRARLFEDRLTVGSVERSDRISGR
jgi:hypothetical protein